jgi:hypothetical protein
MLVDSPPKFLRFELSQSGHQHATSWKHPGRTWGFVLGNEPGNASAAGGRYRLLKEKPTRGLHGARTVIQTAKGCWSMGEWKQTAAGPAGWCASGATATPSCSGSRAIRCPTTQNCPQCFRRCSSGISSCNDQFFTRPNSSPPLSFHRCLLPLSPSPLTSLSHSPPLLFSPLRTSAASSLSSSSSTRPR